MPSLLCFVYQAVLLDCQFSFPGYLLLAGTLIIIASWTHQFFFGVLVGSFLISFAIFKFDFHTQVLAPYSLWCLRYLVAFLLFFQVFSFFRSEAIQTRPFLLEIIHVTPSCVCQTIFTFLPVLFLFHEARSAFRKVLLLIHNSF